MYPTVESGLASVISFNPSRKPVRQGCSGHSVVVKAAVASITDKPQPSETQHKSCSIFVCVMIHFGVPGPVATGDSEIMFNVAVLRCLRTLPSYHQDGEEFGGPSLWLTSHWLGHVVPSSCRI